MKNITSRARIAICATAIAALSLTTLMPTPASAEWYHRGRGWHHGWYHHWHGCCWGPRVVVGAVPPVVAVAPPVVAVAPPVVYAPPPVVYAPPPVVVGRVWIPSHWNGPYWIRGHWS